MDLHDTAAVTRNEATHAAARSASAVAGEYLTLKLGAEEYGIDILKVQEIRGYEKPTRIANAPAFNALLDASYITGLGSVKSGDDERMLILADIEQLMSGTDMGLVDAAVQTH